MTLSHDIRKRWAQEINNRILVCHPYCTEWKRQLQNRTVCTHDAVTAYN